MEIRKLKLSGFKSFVEPAELRIEPGLTGVVGPNGCGKSNLLEAIRWVMGESSPKSMRSGGMEDVIFAGTATRPPRDFAEVVLHARDSENEELNVTRRIERGAGSAYRVNGRDVRAKDVSLVFADAATGAHSPALVSQGKIAQVIAAKPEERRMMLEEAAGIAGLHVRRRDAENKLKATERNLARLEDLMAGLDSQIATLRRQAKQAERYKELSDQIRLAEARLVFARWRDAAAAAEAAREQAREADAAVVSAQETAKVAQAEQAALAHKLADLREELADRRDDASAHGHRMAALASQLDAAQQRLADLDRQKQRLEEDRFDADRLTRDAATAMQALETTLAANVAALAEHEAQRPTMLARSEDAERAGRSAELALAKATADHAGVEADWRVAEAELAQARARIDRLAQDARRLADQRQALASEGDPEVAVGEARRLSAQAAARREELRAALDQQRARKDELTAARDAAASTLSTARADLSGIEREWQALVRDRDARAKQAQGKHGLPIALDRLAAEPGYERALAAVLGRDAKAPLGSPEAQADGRYWTGAAAPAKVADSLADHLRACPPELAARLALVHVAEADDGRVLGPGEWLVTKAGFLRRWDGFVARGEGAAEAARLEADNRLADLETRLPALRSAVAEAQAAHDAMATEAADLQRQLVGAERAMNEAAEAERQALRALDQAEARRERLAQRLGEIAASEADLAEQHKGAQSDLNAAETRKGALPDPASGRMALDAARMKHEAARENLQAAMAALAAHDQGLAVSRERVAAQRSDKANWEARAGEAAQRLAGMERRFEEIAEERAVVAAKPAGLMAEIEGGEALRARLTAELAAAEAAVATGTEEQRRADVALAEATEALSTARENRATLATRAENEEQRREEMARISGERFQCPPPLLAERFAFDQAKVLDSGAESTEMDRLIASRERIGPVNLVAADELARIETEHGASAAEQQELTEAVHRLRGSIGNLTREGRER